MRRREVALIVLSGSLTLISPMQIATAQESEPTSLPEIRVIGTTPLSTVSSPRRSGSDSGSSTPNQPSTPAAPIVPVVSAPPPRADPSLIDRDKVPSTTQTLTADDFTRSNSANVTDT